MFLFDLDLWEARFLIGINWILNLVVRIFVVAAIIAAMQHANTDRNADRPPSGAIQQQEDDVDFIVPPKR
jgi:hypothetical protein